MKLQTVILAVALVTIIGPATAIVYSECQLVTLLTNNGITTDILDWLCLIMVTSRGNTTMLDGPTSDGNYYYGLFQISSKWWCGLNGPGGDCNIACSDLVDDNVADDFACAKKIYEQQGFTAWNNWHACVGGSWLCSGYP